VIIRQTEPVSGNEYKPFPNSFQCLLYILQEHCYIAVLIPASLLFEASCGAWIVAVLAQSLNTFSIPYGATARTLRQAIGQNNKQAN
jgi:hypothetical protein